MKTLIKVAVVEAVEVDVLLIKDAVKVPKEAIVIRFIIVAILVHMD